jgi:hypothetical protein
MKLERTLFGKRKEEEAKDDEHGGQVCLKICHMYV